MKTEFQIKIYKPTVILNSLTDLISEHNNSERKELNLEDINGYIKCQSYRFSMPKLITEIIMDELVVWENGEDVSFIIQQKVMVELAEEKEAEAI